MANYANLLATIAANIYTNGNNEVTAAMVKAAADSMVNSLGDGYQFMGIATPATDPSNPDAKVFYMAGQPGTYTNFGGAVVKEGEVAVLYGSGTSWSKATANASLIGELSVIEGNLYENIGGKNILLYLDTRALSVVGLLQSTDGQVRTSQTAYRTTEYVEIPAGSNAIRWEGVFPSGVVYAGVNLYDSSKQFIAAVNGATYDLTHGNSGSISLADYPTAAYLRASAFNAGLDDFRVECVVVDKYPLADKLEGVTIASVTAPTGAAAWVAKDLLNDMGLIGINFKAGGSINFGVYDHTGLRWLVPNKDWDGWTLCDIPAGHSIWVFAYSNEATSLPVDIEIVRDSPLLDTIISATDSESKVLRVGSDKEYTTIREAITAAYSVKDARVLVYPGTYDLLTEFAAEIAAHSGGKKGNLLGNGMHVLFLPGAYVTANYELENDNAKDSWVYNYFNPFYTEGSDFVLEGLDIEAKNTRYCVHDELAGLAGSTYIHKFLNCRMKYVSDNPAGTYVQAIGGGLGEHGYIEIVGGYYSSTPTPGFPEVGISYHNGNNVNADSSIFISNVYVVGNIRFGAYGSSPISSRAYVSNCSLSSAVENEQEIPGGTSTLFDLTEWNNTIR